MNCHLSTNNGGAKRGQDKCQQKSKTIVYSHRDSHSQLAKLRIAHHLHALKMVHMMNTALAIQQLTAKYFNSTPTFLRLLIHSLLSLAIIQCVCTQSHLYMQSVVVLYIPQSSQVEYDAMAVNSINGTLVAALNVLIFSNCG